MNGNNNEIKKILSDKTPHNTGRFYFMEIGPDSVLLEKPNTMAEIQVSQKNGKRVKVVPRIDLTPMVDLGFILITFFIYTTTITESKMMDIKLPDKTSSAITAFIDTSTITIIPTREHKLAYYDGVLKNESGMQLGNYNYIRSKLINKAKQLKSLPSTYSADAHKLHVIIKPADDCTYDDVVKILDEMLICDVPYYAITDITKEEKEILTIKLQSNLVERAGK